MAKIIPSDFAALEYSDSHPGELTTLRLLHEHLPDDYTVFHSLHWSNARPKYTIFGEIDFVILNIDVDILIIEQKNCALEEIGGELIKNYGRTSKNVGEQVHRIIDNVREKIRKLNPDKRKINFDYLIYVPDHRVLSLNAAAIDRSRVVDASETRDLPKKIEKVLGKGSGAQSELAKAIQDFFNQTLSIVPAVSSYVSAQRKVYTRMIEGLSEVIANLEFEPFRLRVIGTAGSGKSQLTLPFYDRHVAAGKLTLLLCFNRPLADRLQNLTGERLSVDTFHGFCARVAEAAGIDLGFDREGVPDFWRNVIDQMYEVDVSGEGKYGALIVDEGQDFEQEWWDILQPLLEEDAEVLWLEDPLQNLRGTPPVELTGFVTYKDPANFRTPRSLARFIAKALDVDFTAKNTLPGLGVGVAEYDDPTEQLGIVAKRIEELKKLGFKTEEIVIISCHGQQTTAFRDIDRVGNYTLRKSTLKYDDQGQQIYTDGQIYFETIFRFKGQQAPAVIVVDIHEGMKDDDRATRILYCAMTRATVRLELLVNNRSYWQGILVTR